MTLVLQLALLLNVLTAYSRPLLIFHHRDVENGVWVLIIVNK